jgi:hypothetical protein
MGGVLVLFDSIIVGTAESPVWWKRQIEKSSVTITLSPLTPFSKTETQGIANAARRYGEFLKLTAVLR